LEKIVKKKDCVKVGTRFMILEVIYLRENKWVPRVSEEQKRISAEIAKNQRMHGQMGGEQYQQQQGSLKSTSMDSDSFNMRSNKAQTGNMVNKIKEVKQITTTKLGTEMLLGPGGGQGFAWNKPKPTASDSTTTVSNTSSSLNTNKFGVVQAEN